MPTDEDSRSRVELALAEILRDKARSADFQRINLRHAHQYLLKGGAAGAAEPCDVFNQAILKALAGLYRWDPTECPKFEVFFRSVMWGVVGNLHGAADWVHTDRNTLVSEDTPDLDEGNPPAAAVAVAPPDCDPAVSVEVDDEVEYTVERLDAINPKLAQLYLLLRNGFSYQEAAATLGMPLQAVRALRRRLGRALARLCTPPQLPST